jgi:hypothetical protein
MAVNPRGVSACCILSTLASTPPPKIPKSPFIQDVAEYVASEGIESCLSSLQELLRQVDCPLPSLRALCLKVAPSQKVPVHAVFRTQSTAKHGGQSQGTLRDPGYHRASSEIGQFDWRVPNCLIVCLQTSAELSFDFELDDTLYATGSALQDARLCLWLGVSSSELVCSG